MADKNLTGKHKINPGPYSPALRSDQAVPWMNGDDCSFPKASLQRAYQRNTILPLPGKDPFIDKRKSNQEMYGGAQTFKMSSGTGKYETE